MKTFFYTVPMVDIYQPEYNGPHQEYTYFVPSKISAFTGIKDDCLMDFKVEIERNKDNCTARVLVYLDPPPVEQPTPMNPMLVLEYEHAEFYTHYRDVALQVLEIAVDSLRRTPRPILPAIS